MDQQYSITTSTSCHDPNPLDNDCSQTRLWAITHTSTCSFFTSAPLPSVTHACIKGSLSIAVRTLSCITCSLHWWIW